MIGWKSLLSLLPYAIAGIGLAQLTMYKHWTFWQGLLMCILVAGLFIAVEKLIKTWREKKKSDNSRKN